MSLNWMSTFRRKTVSLELGSICPAKRRYLPLLLLVLAGITAAFPDAGRAQDFTVNSTDDRVDANKGDGQCNTGQTVSGQPECTLRAAVEEAAALSAAAHVITVPQGTYALSVATSCQFTEADTSGTFSETFAELCMHGHISLKGAGALKTIIDGGGLTRVILNSADAVTAISGLTIRNGNDQATGTLNNGGGINNQGTLTLTDSIVTGNKTAARAGGISNLGTLSLAGTTVTSNASSIGTGGILSNGTNTVLNLDHSTISYNIAPLGNASGIDCEPCHLTISGSTIAWNSGSYVGGLATSFTSGTGASYPVMITNSTFAHNSGNADGGILFGVDTHATLRNITIAYNSTLDPYPNASGGLSTGGAGGVAIVLDNTLIANNSSGSVDTANCAGFYSSNGYNLVGTQENLGQGSSTTASGYQCYLQGPGTDLLNVDAGLADLADNGGPTQTIGFLAGSVAGDAGSSLAPTDDPTSSACPTLDQRGTSRPIGPACDIGAVEWSMSGAVLSPESMAFGNVTVSSTSSPLSATLSNPGTAPLAITSVAISGPNASQFQQTNTCGSSLSADSTCMIAVTFTPTAPAKASATLSVTDATGVQSVALTGTGTAPAQAQAALSPTSASFGSVATGSTSAAQTFTLANAGNGALAITSVGISGTNAASFQLGLACGSSLAAGASCTISVVFAPTAVGSASATLSVFDAVGTQTASLTGTGTAPPAPLADVSPTSASFGSVNVNATSTPQTFTLKNGGNAALPITSIAITGANASMFTIGSNTCGSTLAAGASCTVSASFKPSSPGSAAAVLAFVDSVGTQTASLNGTGVAVVPPDFSVTASPSSQSIDRDQRASFTIQLASTDANNPYTSSVTLSASGLPTGATATFSPASLVPGTGQPVASSLTISVPALHAGITSTPKALFYEVAGTSSMACVLLLWPLHRRRRYLGLFVWMLVCLGCVAGMAGCGSGTGFAAPGSTSAITVMATSGSTTHTTAVTLKIN